MATNGLKEMLGTFRKVLEGEQEIPQEVSNKLLLGGVVAVLEEVRVQGDKLEANKTEMLAMHKKVGKIDRRLIVVGIVAFLALSAIAAHAGWTWLVPTVIP